ncbi:TonB-dependent receptor family protein [Nitrospirillum pindoramense]|uniref:Iron complex outermembrane receptor protein n=1 Tax=Nitrospirillum amazonense TaxID=28077 RepID=A0A560GYL8_9PROT|nr:TonB-dependent receptor [Nitrospirillum amazonense]TWB39112.1 iron complex outermembrane receptor protein [Nitrospirillum amazonense]
MFRSRPRTGGAIALPAAIALSVASITPAKAQTVQSAEAAPATKAERRAALQHQLDQVQAALAALDAEDAAPATTASPATAAPSLQHEVLVTAERTARRVADQPAGQTMGTVSRDQFKNSPAFSVADILSLTPGVTMLQGNGPRDVSVSVRGSNERQTFGIRNVQVFEDGFPVTQPDGLSRTDLTDPHAYAGIDVIQGPSSALYGNYATGGAINFRTRSGADINGAEAGTDIGDHGYVNVYATAGAQYDTFDYSLFGSHVRGNGTTAHSSFNTTTENLLATFDAGPNDRITVKLVNNDLDTNLSLRLSLNQFNQNPYQAGCAALAAASCAGVSVYANGVNGAKLTLSPDQAGLGRHDRRTIVGARWEHDIDTDTVWRTQFVFDNRDYNQPTSPTSARGTIPSFNLMSDVTAHARVLGLEATHFAGLSFNYEDLNSYSYNLAPPTAVGGGGTLGALTQTIFGHHYNLGARLREEVALAPQWTVVAGVGGDYTDIDALQTAYAYPAGGNVTTTLIRAQRTFFNVAPEASLVYRPDSDWRLHARVATGYGTPQSGNLFVTQQGTFGNNTQLKPQSNVGVDLGAEWTPAPSLKTAITGFYEFFSNELVSQSAGANLQTFTFNAPSSIHRGIEVSAEWQPLPDALPGARLSAAYLLDDQYYDEYVEVLSTGARSAAFNRSGNKIPGVMPSYLNARVAYDQPSGALKGLGGFVEVNHRAAFYLDNANLLKAPGYDLVNVNLHYEPSAPGLAGLRLYVEVRNVFDETYVASASNITDTLSAAGGQNGAGTLAASTGSIWAGSPRTVIGGVRVKF